VRLAKRQTELVKIRFLPGFAPEPAGYALLQNLHYFRGRGIRRFADEQMNVLGHDHVASKLELIAVAHFTEDFDESISGPHGGEERQTPVATVSDEVQVLEPVAATQSFRHGERTKSPALPKTGRTGHPQPLNPNHNGRIITRRGLTGIVLD